MNNSLTKLLLLQDITEELAKRLSPDLTVKNRNSLFGFNTWRINIINKKTKIVMWSVRLSDTDRHQLIGIDFLDKRGEPLKRWGMPLGYDDKEIIALINQMGF